MLKQLIGMALIQGRITEFLASDVKTDELQDCSMEPGNRTSRGLLWWFAESVWLMFLVNTFGYLADLV